MGMSVSLMRRKIGQMHKPKTPERPEKVMLSSSLRLAESNTTIRE